MAGSAPNISGIFGQTAQSVVFSPNLSNSAMNLSISSSSLRFFVSYEIFTVVANGILKQKAHKKKCVALAEVHLKVSKVNSRVLLRESLASDKFQEAIREDLAVPKQAMIVPERFNQCIANFNKLSAPKLCHTN